jgi:hypothetical protein
MSRLLRHSALVLVSLLSMVAACRAQDARQDTWTITAFSETTVSVRPVSSARYFGIGPLLTVSLLLKVGPLADTRMQEGLSLGGPDPLPVWGPTAPGRREPAQSRTSVELVSLESPRPEILVALLRDLETRPEPSQDAGRNSDGVSIGPLTLLPARHSASQ